MKPEVDNAWTLPLSKGKLKFTFNSYRKHWALGNTFALALVLSSVAIAGNKPAQKKEAAKPATAQKQTTEKPAAAQKPAAAEKPDSAATEKLDPKKLDKIVTETKVQRPRKISKQPFVDLLSKVKLMKDLGDFDLEKPFEITATANRSADGTLGEVTINQNTGSPKLEAVARDFMAALRESNALDFLEGSGALNLTAKLNKSDVALTATSEANSVTRAAQLAKGYNALLAIGRAVKSGRDEEAVYENTSVSSNGKQIIVKLSMSREAVGQLLLKQLPKS